MSTVEIFIWQNLSVETVFRSECTCRRSRMRRVWKAGKEHARYGKENTREGEKNKCLPSCHAWFSSCSFSWLGWQTCASKSSLIFVLVIPPRHPRLSVMCGSNLWFIPRGCLRFLLRGPGQAPGGTAAGTGPARRGGGTERGSCRSLRAAADRRRRDDWQQPACSSTKNNV